METHTPTDRACRRDAVDAWAASGLQSLTGPVCGEGLGPPDGLVGALDTVAARIAAASASLGRSVDVDGLATLGARAAIAGLSRNGQVSCGGATHLVQADDGWVAVSLARPDDVDLVPAWLGAAPSSDEDEVWRQVHEACARRSAGWLVERAVQLGLPVAAPPGTAAERRAPVLTTSFRGRAAPKVRAGRLRVADLSSLWAGPLCGSIFAAAGAAVVKVESTVRPDGARRGWPAFFDLLNSDKQCVAVDLATTDGIASLRHLIESVDVVIESSRPRALAQLGLDVEAMLAESAGPRVWISITGHGRDGAGADRVAFGDDAAVAGGLVAWSDGQPYFCADAIADPLTGLVAAAAGLEAAGSGEQVLLDVSMTAVAAHFAGPTCSTPHRHAPPPPVPEPTGAAPALGEHNRSVLGTFGDAAQPGT